MDTWIQIGLIGWQFIVTVYLFKQWWDDSTKRSNQYKPLFDCQYDINQINFEIKQEKEDVHLEDQNKIQDNIKINIHDQEKPEERSESVSNAFQQVNTKLNKLEEKIQNLELNTKQKIQYLEQTTDLEKKILLQEQLSALEKKIQFSEQTALGKINLLQEQLNVQEKKINLLLEQNNQGQVQIQKVNENKIGVLRNEKEKQEKHQGDRQKYDQYFKDKTEAIINSLKQESSRSRQIEQQYKPYVRDLLEKQDFRKYYNLNLQTSNKLFNYCNLLRLVRGDGNCFYTAFGYQFLSILLNDYSTDQFEKFIKKIKSIELPMKINLKGNDFKIDDKELEEQLLQNFLDRLIYLRSIQDENQRQEEFHIQFAAYEKQSETIDSCFYGLSTLFFRNYSNYILDFSESKDAVQDRENLLLWEQECNSNEVIIAELAKQLNIFILLIFIESGSNFEPKKYGNEQNNKIILIMKPGHYNIGYFKQQIKQSQNTFENKNPDISYTNINESQLLQ